MRNKQHYNMYIRCEQFFKRLMKLVIFVFFVFCFNTIHLFSQVIGDDYRTTLDTTNRLHFIKFNSDGILVVNFFGFPGTVSLPPNQVSFHYLIKGDTIFLSLKDTNRITIDNDVINRLISSKFLIKSQDELFDLNSGYTYLNNVVVKKHHMNKDNVCLIILDEKKYMFKRRCNLLFRYNLKLLKSKELETIIIKGPEAYNKYGIKGINGVLLIKEKQ